MAVELDFWREINPNGWILLAQADFTTTVESDKEMLRLNVGNADSARGLIIEKINQLCASANPSANFPRVGRMKWLRGSNQRVKEIRITGDFRLLYNVTAPGEMTFLCLKDHKGVRKHVRDAPARVHNSPMDQFDLSDVTDYEVDLTENPEAIKQKQEVIRVKLAQINTITDIDSVERNFHDVVKRCSIYRLDEHGKSLKLTNEQLDRVSLPSPMLLPGVAGTGKSTVLQARYIRLLEEFCLQGQSKNFFEETIYLTFHKRLAEETIDYLQDLTKPEYKDGVKSTVFSLEEWSKNLLNRFRAVNLNDVLEHLNLMIKEAKLAKNDAGTEIFYEHLTQEIDSQNRLREGYEKNKREYQVYKEKAENEVRRLGKSSKNKNHIKAKKQQIDSFSKTIEKDSKEIGKINNRIEQIHEQIEQMKELFYGVTDVSDYLQKATKDVIAELVWWAHNGLRDPIENYLGKKYDKKNKSWKKPKRSRNDSSSTSRLTFQSLIERRHSIELRSSQTEILHDLLSLLDLKDSPIWEKGRKLTFNFFRKWWSKRNSLKKYDPAQAWEEYRGVLRGSKEAMQSPTGFLSKEAYCALPAKRTAYSIHEREELYENFIFPFQNSLVSSEKWDDLDLARLILGSKNFVPLYRHIYIDEVQDLTEVQLYLLLRIMIPGSRSFDATGDISQQVYPSRFRWEETKVLIYNELNLEIGKLAPPLNTSYRSVRSIVDLANWYLEQMDDDNKQGHEIEEALTSEAGVHPSIISLTSEEAIDLLVTHNLPQPHCPLIVRNEDDKREISEQIKKVSAGEQDNIDSSLFVFTIAESKGLEFNYIITWDLTSGSGHLLKRAHHPKRSQYLEQESWNIQMEYKHAFVAVTRSRLLLLHLSLHHPDYGVDPLMSKLVDESLASIQEDQDLSLFTEVVLSEEELQKLADSYRNAQHFKTAAAVYRSIGLDNDAIYCDFEAAFEDEEFLNAAEFARDLLKNNPDHEQKFLHDISNRCKIELMNMIESGKTSSLLLELLSFHSRKIGDEHAQMNADAEKYELDARSTGRKVLWKKAAQKWTQLSQHRKAAYAWKKAGDLITATQSLCTAKSWARVRSTMLEYLENSDDDQIVFRVLLHVPVLLENDHYLSEKNQLEEIFGIDISKQLLQLPPEIRTALSLEENCEDSNIFSEIRRINAGIDPKNIAKLHAEKEDFVAALSELRSGNLFEKGVELYADKIHITDLRFFIQTNDLEPEEWLMLISQRFSKVKESDGSEVAKFFATIPISYPAKSAPIGTLARALHQSISIIRRPFALSKNKTENHNNLRGLFQVYQEPKIIGENNTIILMAIRLALLRIFQATELKFGRYEVLETPQGESNIGERGENHALLMGMAELVIKFHCNPLHARLKHYIQVREIILYMIEHHKYIDMVDVLYDWLILAEQLHNPKGKLAFRDLFSLTRVYGSDSVGPYFHLKDTDDFHSPFNNKYCPESIISRDQNEFRLPDKSREKIWNHYERGKSTGIWNDHKRGHDKAAWIEDNKSVLFEILAFQPNSNILLAGLLDKNIRLKIEKIAEHLPPIELQLSVDPESEPEPEPESEPEPEPKSPSLSRWPRSRTRAAPSARRGRKGRSCMGS